MFRHWRRCQWHFKIKYVVFDGQLATDRQQMLMLTSDHILGVLHNMVVIQKGQWPFWRHFNLHTTISFLLDGTCWHLHIFQTTKHIIYCWNNFGQDVNFSELSCCLLLKANVSFCQKVINQSTPCCFLFCFLDWTTISNKQSIFPYLWSERSDEGQKPRTPCVERQHRTGSRQWLWLADRWGSNLLIRRDTHPWHHGIAIRLQRVCFRTENLRCRKSSSDERIIVDFLQQSFLRFKAGSRRWSAASFRAKVSQILYRSVVALCSTYRKHSRA